MKENHLSTAMTSICRQSARGLAHSTTSVFGACFMIWLGLAMAFCSFNSTAATTVVITAQNFSFTPNTVTIFVGDSVSFYNAAGDHNVTGYNPAPPPERFCGTTLSGPGPLCTVTFTNAGVFQFRCSPHSSGSGTNFSGMIGSITVRPPPIPVVVPGHFFVTTGGSVTLSLTNTVNVPSIYQWRFNGTNIADATNATLTLSSLALSQSGSYSVTVSNGYQVVTAAPAIIQVVDRLTITEQPASTNAPAGSNVTLRVGALSLLPISYQWQFNGDNLPGATNAVLSFTNVQFDPHTGDYRVLVSDNSSNVWSDTVTLLVLTRPVITNQPLAQTVLQGGTAIFTVVAGPSHPLLPLNYRWVRQGANFLSNAPPTLVITNVQPGMAGSFRVTVTNLAGSVNSTTANLTVLADFDRDGMADAWETLYGFDTNSVADALLDHDFDGVINRDEYVAGTIPTNATSVLKVQLASPAGGQWIPTFLAVSNRTYTVEWNTEASGETWNRLQDVLARPTNWLESVTDTNAGGPMRFYRVVTPRRP